MRPPRAVPDLPPVSTTPLTCSRNSAYLYSLFTPSSLPPYSHLPAAGSLHRRPIARAAPRTGPALARRNRPAPPRRTLRNRLWSRWQCGRCAADGREQGTSWREAAKGCGGGREHGGGWQRVAAGGHTRTSPPSHHLDSVPSQARRDRCPVAGSPLQVSRYRLGCYKLGRYGFDSHAASHSTIGATAPLVGRTDTTVFARRLACGCTRCCSERASAAACCCCSRCSTCSAAVASEG